MEICDRQEWFLKGVYNAVSTDSPVLVDDGARYDSHMHGRLYFDHSPSFEDMREIQSILRLASGFDDIFIQAWRKVESSNGSLKQFLEFTIPPMFADRLEAGLSDLRVLQKLQGMKVDSLSFGDVFEPIKDFHIPNMIEAERRAKELQRKCAWKSGNRSRVERFSNEAVAAQPTSL